MSDCCCYFAWEFVWQSVGSYFVCGGRSAGGFLSDTDEYVIAIDSFTSRQAMPAPGREVHSTAVVSDGYSFSGAGSSGGFQDNDSYNKASDAWAARTDTPDISTNGQACGIGVFAYLIGGLASSGRTTANYQYSPSGDSWASKTSSPTPARATHAGEAIASTGYLWGGNSGSSGATKLSDNDAYDSSGDSWSSLTNLPAPARDSCDSFAIGGKGYVVGGREGAAFTNTNMADNDEYDPSGDAWANRTSMTVARNALACQSASGKGFAATGENDFTDFGQSNELYDPSSDAWSTLTIFSTGRNDAAAFGF